MLKNLLDELEKDKIASPGLLAQRLGVSPALVEVMLEHLERLGRLQPVVACVEQSACAGCPAAGATCALPGSSLPAARKTRLWKLKS